MTVNKFNYTDDLEPKPDNYNLHPYDLRTSLTAEYGPLWLTKGGPNPKAKSKWAKQGLSTQAPIGGGEPAYPGIGYLLKPLTAGEVHVAVRGKEMVVTGAHVSSCSSCLSCVNMSIQHCNCLHFGLQADIRSMELRFWPGTVSTCVPGPNDDPHKAECMRSFVIPPELYEKGSREDGEPRLINIFAALVCQDRVFVISDTDRIVRMHVTSLNRHWTADDLKPGSEVQSWSDRTTQADVCSSCRCGRRYGVKVQGLTGSQKDERRYWCLMLGEQKCWTAA